MSEGVANFSDLLRGVRILDCTRNIAGPVATMLAAEMGADVIKLEPPGGDEMRQWPPFAEGESVYFASCNRGKRSISVDLKTGEGVALFRRLLATADVLVENFRPGTLEKFGLGWDTVRGLHPRLVWVSVSGYGRSGPLANAPAYDSMMQAFTGMMHITGEQDRAPVRGGGSPIDIATAYLAWGAIMTGLYSVGRTGVGQILEVSLMDSALGMMHSYFQAELMGVPMPGRMGSETAGIYPLGAFLAQDGEYCLIQVSNQHQWSRFCATLGLEHLEQDPLYLSNPLRVQNRDMLRPQIAARIGAYPVAEIEELLTRAGVPASHVRGLDAVARDPQVLARHMVKEVLLGNGTPARTWGNPVKVNELLETPRLAVPAFDQHRESILASLNAPANP